MTKTSASSASRSWMSCLRA